MAELEFQNVPTLTLDPITVETKEDTLAGPEFPANAPAVPSFEESSLTEAERKIVNDFAQKIELTNSNVVLQYGAAAQKKIADFADQSISTVRTKDLGEVGDMLTHVVTELKDFDEEEQEIRHSKSGSTHPETATHRGNL